MAPGGEALQGEPEDPTAEFGDDSAVLGDVDELVGEEQLSGLGPEARQGLGACDASVGDPHDRLEVHLDPVCVDGESEFLLYGVPADGLCPQVVVEQFGPVAPLILGPVHGDVGVAEKVAGGLVAVGDGDADAGRDHR